MEALVSPNWMPQKDLNRVYKQCHFYILSFILIVQLLGTMTLFALLITAATYDEDSRLGRCGLVEILNILEG